MLPQIIWNGASKAYWLGMLIPIMSLAQIKNDSEIVEKTILEFSLYTFFFLGLGQVLSGLLMTVVINKTGLKWACLINLLFALPMAVITIFIVKNEKFNWMCSVTMFLWGLQDGTVTFHSFQMLGTEFET